MSAARARAALSLTPGSAVVCGFDVAGFTPWVDAIIARDGPRAAEAITDRLQALFDEGAAHLAANGFTIADDLGDGLLAYRVQPRATPAALKRIGRELAAAVTGAPVRAAAAFGAIWLGHPPLPRLSGPGVADFHARCRAVSPTAARFPPAAPVAPPAGKLAASEVAERLVCFVRLPPERSPTALLRPLELTRLIAEAQGGSFEKATHDDKGVLARVLFFATRDGHAGAERFAEAVVAALAPRRVGIALAAGPLYRGPTRVGARQDTTIHGAVVNRAAKLAALTVGVATDLSVGAVAGSAGAAPAATAAVRERELARISSAVGIGGSPIFLTGASGIGKTRLLARLVERERPRRLVLEGAARPQHRFDSFRLWADLAGQLLHHDPAADAALGPRERLALGQLLGAPRVSLAAGERVPLTRAALVALIESHRPATPTLVAADDVQWVDRSSRRLLELAAAQPGWRVVAATRGRELRGRPLALAGMSARDLGALAHAAGLPATGSAVAKATRLSQGNPLHALQLLRAAAEGAGDAVELGAVLDQRIDRLTAPARACLRAAAVLDRAVPGPALEAMVQGLGTCATGGLDELVHRDFVRPGPAGHRVVHAAITAHVQARLPESVRRDLHRSAARYLSRAGGAARAGRGEVAGHWLAAGAVARAAAGYLASAEQALEDGAHLDAGRLFDAARGAGVEMSGERLALLEAGAGLAAWGSGNVRAAAAASRRAGGLLRGAKGRRGELAARRHAALRSEVGMFTGQLREIVAGNWSSAFAHDVPGASALARARGLSFVGFLSGVARLSPLARVAFRAASRVGGELGAAYAAAAEAVWHLAFGRRSEAEFSLARAESCLGSRAEPHLREVLITLLALSAHQAGRFDEAAALFADLEARALGRGNRLHEAWGQYGRAMPLIEQGRVAEAARLIRSARTLLAGNADRQSVMICRGLAAQAAWRAGQPAQALAEARRAARLALAVPPTNFGSLEGYAALADVASSAAIRLSPLLYPDDIRRGLAALDRYARLMPIGRPRALLVRARVAQAGGDLSGAGQLAARSMALAERYGLGAEVRRAEQFIEGETSL